MRIMSDPSCTCACACACAYACACVREKSCNRLTRLYMHGHLLQIYMSTSNSVEIRIQKGVPNFVLKYTGMNSGLHIHAC